MSKNPSTTIDDLARRMRKSEDRARAALADIPQAAAILDRAGDRRESTRAGAVHRLGEAVQAIRDEATHSTDAKLKRAASEAGAAWDEAQTLAWRLAMMGRHIANIEARKLAGRFLEEPDLVQEGYLGLLDAAHRYDPERQIKFTTYAKWWVRARMTRAIDYTGRPVRLPGGAVEQLRNLRKVRKALEAAGETPSLTRLAAEAGVERDRAEFLLSRGTAVSLEEPVEGGRKPRKLGDVLADDEAEGPGAQLEHAQTLAALAKNIETVLPERHRVVLTARFGLDGQPRQTLSDLGRHIQLSRERVRQLEKEGIGMLRKALAAA